jgi:hypothetical protein
MRINGNLVFQQVNDGIGAEIQNFYIEKKTGLQLGAISAANNRGRVVFVTTAGSGFNADTFYFSDGTSWISFATGGNAAALQAEVDAIEATLGTAVNGDGTHNSGAWSSNFSTLGGTPSSFTDAINKLATYAVANDTLAELNDVSLSALASGQVLQYNGSVWVNHTLVLADISNLTVTAAELNLLSGLTSNAADLNKLDLFTGNTADLNVLSGVAAMGVTPTEVGYLDGVTSPIQTQLDNKQPLDATLTSLAALDATPGILVETAADTFTKRSLVAPAAGITITNPAGVAGNPTFALADDLAAVEGLTTTGYAVRTGSSTWTTRVINGVTGKIVVTNGDGVASNTDIDLATVTDSGTGSFLKFTRDTYGRVTGTTAVVAGDITALVDSTYVNVTGDTMTGDLNMGTNYVKMDNPPTLATHAANKAYVDAAVAGLSWKKAVRVATTGNITLTPAPASIDGVTLVTNDRVLVKDQTSAAQNGVYVFNGTDLVRATDMDAAAEFAGATVFVTEGTTNADTGWTQTAEVVTLGTDPVTWVQFSGSNAYIWGTGLGNSGNTVFVKLGAGIKELPTDEVGIDVAPNVAVQLTGGLTGDQLTLVLESGGGLTQSSAGLKIANAGVTNAMLQNNSITFNSDSGNTAIALGSTLLIAGTSAQGISTSVTGSTLTITAANASASQKGVASFDASEFTVTAGNVVLGTVPIAKLSANTIGITGTDASNSTRQLGQSFTIASAVSGLVSATSAGGTVTFNVRLATTSATGVASFDANHFSVTAGAVSLNASLDDLTNVSNADTAATGDLLTKTAGDWQPISRVTLAGTINLGDLGNVGTADASQTGNVLIANGTQWEGRPIYFLYSGASATNHTVTHNLGQKYCNVTVVDTATDEVIIPQSITFNSANQLTVTLTSALAIKVVVMGV